jgi:quinolinate synthase
MNSEREKIERLKKERDAVILAHYYVNEEVQSLADYVGDSYYLSRIAAESSHKTIVFCGVFFMGESAKILSPEKTVLLPDLSADCPMAHMAYPEEIEAIRREIDDIAVVCYINSSAEVKACSDVCVTSANALQIIKKLPQHNIYFIPDANLGRYISTLVPEKKFYFNNGFCPTHARIDKAAVLAAKAQHPNAKMLAHPECTEEVLDLADYIGSTSGIIKYATENDGEYIICTEEGILYELKQKNPDKQFYFVEDRPICQNMKKLTVKKVLDSLENMQYQVELPEALRKKAAGALEKMLELSK